MARTIELEAQPLTTRFSCNSARYVKIPLFCAITGFTEKAVRRKIEDGEWRRGEHYIKVGASILMDMEAYYKWVERERDL